MPRYFRDPALVQYPYALPAGPHKVIDNAARVIAELTSDENRKLMSMGFKPRHTLVIRSPRNLNEAKTIEVVLLSIREHTVHDLPVAALPRTTKRSAKPSRNPFAVADDYGMDRFARAGHVTEIFGQVFIPGYKAHMQDVCIIHFSGYREGIILPIKADVTIVEHANRKKFAAARAEAWVR